MLPASLGSGSRPRRVLCVGCHADDIEIGCGGTLLSLVAREPGLDVTWLVLSAPGERGDEARASAAAFSNGLTNPPLVLTEEFRDGFFPYLGGLVKDRFERLKMEIDPDLI